MRGITLEELYSSIIPELYSSIIPPRYNSVVWAGILVGWWCKPTLLGRTVVWAGILVGRWCKPTLLGRTVVWAGILVGRWCKPTLLGRTAGGFGQCAVKFHASPCNSRASVRDSILIATPSGCTTKSDLRLVYKIKRRIGIWDAAFVRLWFICAQTDKISYARSVPRKWWQKCLP
jgi:hypothetical protein